MIAQYFMAAAGVVTGLAAWTDWRTGHIPNWLSLGALGLAPIAHMVVAVLTGRAHLVIEAAGFSLMGAAAVGLGPILLYRIGGICGGDVKLLAAVGAICGIRSGMLAELSAFIAAAFFVLVRFAYQGKLLATLGTSMRLLANPFLSPSKRRPVERETLTELRFGPAIFAGVLVAALAEWTAK